MIACDLTGDGKVLASADDDVAVRWAPWVCSAWAPRVLHRDADGLLEGDTVVDEPGAVLSFNLFEVSFLEFLVVENENIRAGQFATNNRNADLGAVPGLGCACSGEHKCHF